jgi:hypothetical protein
MEMMESNEATFLAHFMALVNFVRNLLSSSENFRELQNLTKFTRATKSLATSYHGARHAN